MSRGLPHAGRRNRRSGPQRTRHRAWARRRCSRHRRSRRTSSRGRSPSAMCRQHRRGTTSPRLHRRKHGAVIDLSLAAGVADTEGLPRVTAVEVERIAGEVIFQEPSSQSRRRPSRMRSTGHTRHRAVVHLVRAMRISWLAFRGPVFAVTAVKVDPAQSSTMSQEPSQKPSPGSPWRSPHRRTSVRSQDWPHHRPPSVLPLPPPLSQSPPSKSNSAQSRLVFIAIVQMPSPTSRR